MCGDGEIEVGKEGYCDVEDAIFVAVGKNVKESKSILLWVLQNFPGKDICFLHVHQPPLLLSLMDGKLSASKLKQQVVKAYLDLEQQKMHKLLNQYLDIDSQIGACKVWVEMEDIGKGIVQIIAQHGIKWLVMGAAAEKHFSKEMTEVKSRKAIFVSQHAPASCHIWFVCKGCIVYTRSFNVGSHMSSFMALSNPVSTGGVNLLHDHAADVDLDVNTSESLEQSVSSEDEVVENQKLTSSLMDGIGGNVSPSSSQHESQNHRFHSHSINSLEAKYQLEVNGDVHDKLEHVIIDAERSKQKAFEQSVKRWKTEEDALEAARKAEAFEELCMKEIDHQKEMEEMLATQKKELEGMKRQHDQLRKELQLVQDQELALESQITKSHGTEKELEDKIIQAVQLLVSFKKKRDEMQTEHRDAVEEVNKLRKLVKDDTVGLHKVQLFSCSFTDIIEATKNFDPSSKIAEGWHGSTYKGLLHHVKVAIKMLPSGGSLSDAEFERKVGVLSRVRHPNLVTLIGTCPESRSLVYEYLENGSLEDCLACRGKTPPLSWKSRLRVAITICSALVFLHSNRPPIVHGNLKLTKVLFGSNFVCKLSDLGIYHVLPHDENPFSRVRSKNDPEVSTDIDPECQDDEEITAESDVYSFGIILLRLLTGRPISGLVKDVKCSLESGNLNTVLDISAGDWPLEQAKQIAHLGLRCCEKCFGRPDLVSDVWNVLEPMKHLCISSCEDSKAHCKIPSHFLCPIYQEVMKDPYIAADGFTYEADAISGWINSGHKTSPMTNLKLEHCDLLPNYALYYAIQEWQQQS